MKKIQLIITNKLKYGIGFFGASLVLSCSVAIPIALTKLKDYKVKFILSVVISISLVSLIVGLVIGRMKGRSQKSTLFDELKKIAYRNNQEYWEDCKQHCKKFAGDHLEKEINIVKFIISDFKQFDRYGITQKMNAQQIYNIFPSSSVNSISDSLTAHFLFMHHNEKIPKNLERKLDRYLHNITDNNLYAQSKRLMNKRIFTYRTLEEAWYKSQCPILQDPHATPLNQQEPRNNFDIFKR